jgi:hypothetical protein
MADIEGGPKESENQTHVTAGNVAKPRGAAATSAVKPSDGNVTVDPHEVSHIDAVRRVSEIRVQNKNATNEEKLAENNHSPRLRRHYG